MSTKFKNTLGPTDAELWEDHFLGTKEPTNAEIVGYCSDSEENPAKQTVYFINEDELNMGWLAHDPESMINWLETFLDNLHEGEEVIVKFKKREMTRAEIEALPEI
jgi:hypothetical protein